MDLFTVYARACVRVCVKMMVNCVIEREGGGGGWGCGIYFVQNTRYKYFCRQFDMVIANANITRVSLRRKWIYSQRKQTKLF